MSKPTITRLFVGSLIAIFGGIMLAVIGGIAAFASGAFVMSGPDVVGITPTGYGWTMIAVAAIGGLTIVAGALGQFVAWIGAVLNTARLDDKAWFVILLVLGLLSFGFVATLVYLIVGPDGTRPEAAAQTTYSTPVAPSSPPLARS
jgi:hypothetical protein